MKPTQCNSAGGISDKRFTGAAEDKGEKIEKFKALRRLAWVLSLPLGLIKAGRKSNRRRGDAEARGGIAFSPQASFPHLISASPRFLFDFGHFNFSVRLNPNKMPQSLLIPLLSKSIRRRWINWWWWLCGRWRHGQRIE